MSKELVGQQVEPTRARQEGVGGESRWSRQVRLLGASLVSIALTVGLLGSANADPGVSATIAMAGEPNGVAMSKSSAHAFVTNTANNTVEIVQTSTNTVVATVALGATGPVGIAVSPSGAKAFVAASTSDEVVVVDTSTRAVTKSIALPSGAAPDQVAFTPDGALAFVTNAGKDTVTVIDTTTEAISTSIGVGTAPTGIAITPDGTTAFVTNSGSANVSVVDVATKAVTSTIATGATPRSVAITPDGTTAYVVLGGTNQVQLLDVASKATTGTPIAVGATPNRVVVTQDGLHALVTHTDATTGGVTFIDTATQTVTLPVVGSGKGSLGVAVAYESSVAYVTRGTETGVQVITMKPSSPTNVTAKPKNWGGRVFWNPPTRTGGQPITGYTVTSSPLGKTCTTTTKTSCRIKGLGGNREVTFTVTATNAFGTSNPSAATTPVISKRPQTRLAVRARRERKQLKLRRSPKVVKNVKTNGRVRKIRVNCFKDGQKLKRRAKRRACGITYKRQANNAQAWVKPRCSQGLTVKAKVVVVKGSRKKNKWTRTWEVRNRRLVSC